MIEIEFSYIHNFQNDQVTLAALVNEFGAEHNVKVHLREMTWQTAWAELFGFASHGSGPHVSHVGGTWVSSLARMNVLRPFTAGEIASMGGESAFMSPTWASCTLFDDQRIWAIPWTGWIYVVCYRKDLLEKAGIDLASAFGTIQALDKTVASLATSALEIPWLNPQLPVAYRDLLHIAASWIWAAGGDFINDTGTKVMFNSPKAIEGLREWLDIYRAVYPAHKKLSEPETLSLFCEGRVAAVLTNIREADKFLDMEDSPVVRENLGVATLTDAPWTGGGDFVVWGHVQGYPEQEQAAVDLVKFLVSKEVNLRCRRELATMPARMDALEEVYPAGNPLHDAVMLAAHRGRAYRNIPLWRRIEVQLAEELGAAVKEANDNLSSNPLSILRARLDPLARRLNQTLGN